MAIAKYWALIRFIMFNDKVDQTNEACLYWGDQCLGSGCVLHPVSAGQWVSPHQLISSYNIPGLVLVAIILVTPSHHRDQVPACPLVTWHPAPGHTCVTTMSLVLRSLQSNIRQWSLVYAWHCMLCDVTSAISHHALQGCGTVVTVQHQPRQLLCLLEVEVISTPSNTTHNTALSQGCRNH